ncbi:MAG: DUF4142 domain-containing protein [Candidatus Eremiobacteraeota bacterium]|nr:DUF4142 domain-containing protein [Candidatus Eremiobacteraeota bacterium]
MKNIGIGVATLALLATTLAPAIAQQNTGSQDIANSADQQFVTQALKGGGQEVDQANAQLQASSSPSVKLFAQTMIRDHTQANGQIAALAQNLGLHYPKSHIQTSPDIGTNAAPPAMGSPPPAVTNPKPVAAMSDQAYMQQEVQDHQQTIALFENEVKNGSSQGKALAAQMLPTLKAHLAMAQQYMNTGRVSPEVTPTPPGPGMPPR